MSKDKFMSVDEMAEELNETYPDVTTQTLTKAYETYKLTGYPELYVIKEGYDIPGHYAMTLDETEGFSKLVTYVEEEVIPNAILACAEGDSGSPSHMIIAHVFGREEILKDSIPSAIIALSMWHPGVAAIFAHVRMESDGTSIVKFVCAYPPEEINPH